MKPPHIAIAAIAVCSLAAQAAGPEFEVASIKANTSGSHMVSVQPTPGGRYNATNVTLNILIQFAYNVRAFQISGGPSWMNDAHFDVTAKAANNASLEEMRPMMQALLTDRFQLALHRETKDYPVYVMTAAKGGLKLQGAKEGGCTMPNSSAPPAPPQPGGKLPCGAFMMRPGGLDANATNMERFAGALGNILGRTVVDKTGYTGTFDVHIEFARDEAVAGLGGPGPGPAAAPESSGASIFTVLQDQLGLKLDSGKGPVEMLVIDRAEKPSEN